MKKNNVQIGICQWCLPIEGPYACKVAADLGLAGIELELGSNYENSPITRKYVQNAFLEAGEKWGIKFPSLGVNALCTYGASKTNNKDIVRSIIDKAILVASSMNIPLLQIPSFVDGDIKTEDEFINTAEFFKYACDRAKEYNIIVGTENSLSWEENIKLLEMVGRDNIKVYFDTQNPYVCKGYDCSLMVEKLSNNICEVHAKDGVAGKMSNALLGSGESGFYDTVESLIKHEFKGWVNLENNYYNLAVQMNYSNPLDLIKNDIETLRRVFT